MFYSFEEKLARAHYHLNLLWSESNQWIESCPYTITDEIDPNTGDNVIRSKLIGSPPPIVSQILGDCLHNFRATLDHLVHALALKNRLTLTDAEAIQVAFPIFRCKLGFQSRGMGKIKHISGEAQTIINRLQPYHAGNNATSHPLWILEKLENIDKHRRLLVTVASSGGGIAPIPRGTRQEFLEWSFNRSIQQEAEIARYRCVNVNTGERVKVNFVPSFAIFIADGPAQGKGIISVLTYIFRSIEGDVLPSLRKLL